MEIDKLKDEHHSFDGIQEYDNPLPKWWIYLFYICIIVGPWHFAYYSAKGLVWRSLKPKETAVAWSTGKLAYADQIEAAKPKTEVQIDLGARVVDPLAIARGAELFAANCVACHGAEGQGIVGPNLTDKYWIHGGTNENIVKTIAEGVPAKGMVSWKPILGQEKVYDLTAFVVSLEGKVVSNPKAPEGEAKP